MAKYKGNNRIVDADEKTYSQEMTEQNTAQGSAPSDSDEASFKKRYGDLRRHMQQSLSQKDKELEEMKSQLETATREQIRFPKSDDEIDQWSKKYPDVAQIVDTIAQKRAKEALEEGEKRLSGLKNLETKLTRKEAEQQLLRMHPDFMKIRSDPSFHDWVSLQPNYIRDALYKNGSDAKAASRAIDLYKADKGIRKRKATNVDAAKDIGRTSRTTPTPGGKAKFSESQVSKMSDTEYEKHEDAILTAMRDGNFNFDMTGAAR